MIQLLALALLPFQTAELLPPAPDGWRYERLDFPLGFAPDLDYEGFEELWFAPGMFEPDSDSYFSYLFAIRLRGEHHVDPEFLRGFLSSYYVGLCKAVAEGREMELDLDEIAVEVRRSPAGFDCGIHMFDAFTTGAALDLELELRVHAGPGTTELLALASPLERTEPIWKELRAMEQAWTAGHAPAAYFNHLYVVADPETYAALETSEFLREEFGVFEARRTVRADLTYEGLYFYGQRTYFEFLRPDPANGFQPGDTGLAFGFEEPGGTARAVEALAEQGVTAFAGPVSRELEGKQVPWFEMLGVQKPDTHSRLTLFSLEYVPEFLPGWHSQLAPEAGAIDRGSILERYGHLLGRQAGSKAAPFLDVTELELQLSSAELARWREVARTFGFEEEKTADGLLFAGPEMRYRIAGEPAADGQGAITAMSMRLARPIEREPLRLGSMELRFQGETARMVFRP